MVRELTIISGKGGTGKTSVAASFAVLAKRPVVADCDVDAADLHLVLAPRTTERHEFRSGHEAVIRQADCIGCGACLAHCRFGAVKRHAVADGWALSSETPSNCDACDYCQRSCSARTQAIIQEMQQALGDGRTSVLTIAPLACEGCGVCVRFCPVKAIDFPERVCGEWMVSDTRSGPMVHAQLLAGADNSGKLVSLVRKEARRIALEQQRSLVIVDGPPGIGCPVIASVTGATAVLAVTEPTVSGEHDVARALALTKHFRIPSAVCVNKWDLNPGMTERIEELARQAGARVLGRIRYDPAVTAAQLQEQAAVETEAPCAGDIRRVWDQLGLEE